MTSNPKTKLAVRPNQAEVQALLNWGAKGPFVVLKLSRTVNIVNGCWYCGEWECQVASVCCKSVQPQTGIGHTPLAAVEDAMMKLKAEVLVAKSHKG